MLYAPVSDCSFRFTYSARAATRMLSILLAAEVFLAAVYLFTLVPTPDNPLAPLREFFDVDREVSIPTWFSTIQLFTIAVVVWMQAREISELKSFLLVLACGYLFLSIDEAASVHDSLFKAAQNARIPWLKGVEYLAWMVPYSTVGLIGLVVGLRPALTLWRHFPCEAAWIALGAALLIIGGMGMEVITHILYMIAKNVRFYLAVAAEEFLEMAGQSVMLYGFLLLGIRIQESNVRRQNGETREASTR